MKDIEIEIQVKIANSEALLEFWERVLSFKKRGIKWTSIFLQLLKY